MLIIKLTFASVHTALLVGSVTECQYLTPGIGTTAIRGQILGVLVRFQASVMF